MSARLLRAGDRTPRAWKNGGGVTHDIAVFPEGAGDGDFLWRASLATIAEAGPFSTFPGVDRVFLLLGGDLAIAIGDQPEQHIETGAPALLFGGEESVSARPVAGSCRALNIMARRGRVSIALDTWADVRPSAAGALLLFARVPTTVAVGDETFELGADDALLLDRPADLGSISGPIVAAGLFV